MMDTLIQNASNFPPSAGVKFVFKGMTEDGSEVGRKHSFWDRSLTINLLKDAMGKSYITH